MKKRGDKNQYIYQKLLIFKQNKVLGQIKMHQRYPLSTFYSVEEDTNTPGKGKLFNTLPRSLRQQNLVTSVREIEDPKVIQERQELIKNYSPAELAQFKGITDFPVPSKITNLFEKKETKRA